LIVQLHRRMFCKGVTQQKTRQTHTMAVCLTMVVRLNKPTLRRHRTAHWWSLSREMTLRCMILAW
jgi:hypothetical protein